jgi:hypothetical protein
MYSAYEEGFYLFTEVVNYPEEKWGPLSFKFLCQEISLPPITEPEELNLSQKWTIN